MVSKTHTGNPACLSSLFLTPKNPRTQARLIDSGSLPGPGPAASEPRPLPSSIFSPIPSLPHLLCHFLLTPHTWLRCPSGCFTVAVPMQPLLPTPMCVTDHTIYLRTLHSTAVCQALSSKLLSYSPTNGSPGWSSP